MRIDPQDNIWVVDQMSSMVIKFDPNGQIQLLLGRKSESERLPAAPAGGRRGAGRRWRRRAGGAPGEAGGRGGRGGPPGAGAQSDVFQRPTDVAWDAAGNIYVADGYGNSRVAKFDKNGKFIKSWGSRGTATGQFNVVHGIAIDAQGNVYVADSGNRRIQVFDGEGNFKTQFADVGAPAAICISGGAHPYLYSSNSNPPDDIDVDGEIYKMELRRANRRQVRQGRKAPEGIRHGQCDRLPQRKRALRGGARQLESPETHAAFEVVQRNERA